MANLDPSFDSQDVSMSIEQAVRKAKAGDRQALGQMIAQCRGYLLAIAHAELDETVRGKVAVSDVVQDTLLRVQQKLPDFRGETESELLGWIRRILLNHIADVRRAYRQTDKRRIDLEVPLDTHQDVSGMAMLQLAIDTATPGRAAVAGEELDSLKTAIAGLSEDYRTVLALRTWERLPFSEVGKRMSRSSDAARVLWSRAVRQLSLQLQTDEHEST